MLVMLSGTILVTGIIAASAAFYVCWKEVQEVYDAQLANSAKMLSSLVTTELPEPWEKHTPFSVEPSRIDHFYEKNLTYRVWQGDVLLTESNAAFDFGDMRPPLGYSDAVLAGEKWRFFVHTDLAHDLTVETAERYEIRYELIDDIMYSLAFPMLPFILISGLLVFVITRQLLTPMMRISAAVNARNAEDLSPIETDRLPNEILPLVSALNRLLNRVAASLAREHEFTDNAAHELRTPLAAMKTQAQVLARKATSLPDYRKDLQNLGSSIDRATHLIDQLLAFARLQNSPAEMQQVNLSELVQQRVAELAPAAVEKGQEINLQLAPQVTLQGNASALSIMFGNILDNAIKYAPTEGRIEVNLAQHNGLATLEVADQGPGIPAELSDRVFERFYRLPTATQRGSGLGLAIAKFIADQHHASIRVTTNTPHGARFIITLPC